jgi:hypothetical protein
MDIWGIKEFTKLLSDKGYRLTQRGVYYNVRCGNFTCTKKIDDMTYVFSNVDLKNALEYGKKHARHKREKRN